MSLVAATIAQAEQTGALAYAFDFSQTDTTTGVATSVSGDTSRTITFSGSTTISGEDGLLLDGSVKGAMNAPFLTTDSHAIYITIPEVDTFYFMETIDTFYLRHQAVAGAPTLAFKSGRDGAERSITHPQALTLRNLGFHSFFTENYVTNNNTIYLDMGDVEADTTDRYSENTAAGLYRDGQSPEVFRNFEGLVCGMLVFNRLLTEAEIVSLLETVNIYGTISLPTNLNTERAQTGTILRPDRTIDSNFTVAAGSQTLEGYSLTTRGDLLELVAFDSDDGKSILRAAPLDPGTAASAEFSLISGGSTTPSGQTSKVSGVVQVDGAPAQRTVRAFGYNPTPHSLDGETVNLSKSLGHATSDPSTGEYTIDLLAGYGKRIFVVAFDDYGDDFTADMAVAVGDRVHPTTPNGHVWECTSAGTLPSEEPTWIIDTEAAQLYGTASMIARPFYRPMVHGPVTPEITQGIGTFPYLDLVAETAFAHWRLEESTQPFADQFGGSSLTAEGTITTESDPLTGEVASRSVLFTQQGKLNGAGSPIYDEIYSKAAPAFSIEVWVKLSSIGTDHGNGMVYDERAVNGDNPLQIQYIGSLNQFVVDKFPESGNQFYSTAAFAAGQVYHLVYVETETSRRFYVNGLLDSDDNNPEPYTGDPGAIFSIGGKASALSNLFDGAIDELSLHPVALTAQQISDRYSVGTTRFSNEWTPANLFNSNTRGAFYDPSDLTTLFQDVAGTVPVTADGDPVALMKDKSGNGWDAVQSNASEMPTYRTDGTLHWLEDTTANQRLVVPGSASGMKWLHGSGGASVMAGARCGSVTSPDATYGIIATSGSSSANVGFELRYDDRGSSGRSHALTVQVGRGVAGESAVGTYFNDTIQAMTDNMMELHHGAGQVQQFVAVVNGEVVGSGNYEFDPIEADASYDLAIMDNGSDAFNLDGRFYGAILIDRVLSGEDLTQARDFMQARTGTV